MSEKKTNKPGYAGRIGNGGSQHVQAPFKTEQRTGDKKITGKDLRTGK